MGIESPVHLLFIAVVALIVLGPKRLPGLARALGQGIREFRGSLEEGANPAEPADAPSPPTPALPQPNAVESGSGESVSGESGSGESASGESASGESGAPASARESAE
jgi:TatA/E family protein of Tat protein translocase